MTVGTSSGLISVSAKVLREAIDIGFLNIGGWTLSIFWPIFLDVNMMVDSYF